MPCVCTCAKIYCFLFIFSGVNGLAIIVDNVSAVTDTSNNPLKENHEKNNAESTSIELPIPLLEDYEQDDTKSSNKSNSLLSENCKEVQDLEILFTNTFNFLVLNFNNLTSEALHVLLDKVVKTCHVFSVCTFALVILSKGKQQNLYDANNEIIPTQDVLDHFSSPQLADKPKIFIFETVVTNTTNVKELGLNLPQNSIAFTTCPQNMSQLTVLKDRIQIQYHNTPISDIFQDIEEQITANGHHAEYQSNLDPKFILTTCQNDLTK